MDITLMEVLLCLSTRFVAVIYLDHSMNYNVLDVAKQKHIPQ